MDILVVEWQTAAVAVSRFRRKKRGLVLLSHESSATDGSENALLQTAASTRGGSKVVLAIPTARLNLRPLELPNLEQARLRSLLPLELKGETAIDTESAVFDALPLVNGKTLAIWTAAAELEPYINRLKLLGLEPEIVTSTIFHWHSLAPRCGTAAIVGGEGVALFQDGKPLYIRALPAGSEAEEASRTIATFELANGIGIDSVTERPACPDGIDLCDYPDHDPALAGACALALATAEGRTVNLRRGELAYTAGHAAAVKRLHRTLLIATAATTLFCAERVVRCHYLQQDISATNAEIATLYQNVFPGRHKAVDEVAEIKAEIKRLKGNETASDQIGFLKYAAEAKGEIKDIYEVELSGSEVRLKGEADNVAVAEGFRKRLSAAMESAELGEIRTLPNGGTAFTLTGKRKETAQ